MRYAEYRDKKFFVGSGVVEAGCRTVIGERLKQSGMRWSVRGANAIAIGTPVARRPYRDPHVRATIRSPRLTLIARL